MKEALKGICLFILNWVTQIIFYFLSVLAFIGDFLQDMMKTRTVPTVSIYVDILLIILISYFVNRCFIKAKKITFLITQVLFGITVIGLVVWGLKAVAHGIMMMS